MQNNSLEGPRNLKQSYHMTQQFHTVMDIPKETKNIFTQIHVHKVHNNTIHNHQKVETAYIYPR